jgi:hypothetical protein
LTVAAMTAQASNTLTDAQRFIRHAFGNEELQDEYLLKASRGGAAGNAATADEMISWFKSKGYDTTLDQVRDEWTEQLNQTLDYYAGTYNTYLNGRVGPTLSIGSSVVKLGDKEILDPFFYKSTLSWTSDKNSTSGSVTFVLFDSLLDAQGHEVPEDADIFVGAQFHGTYSKAGQATPLTSNFYGRVGIFPADFIQKLQGAASHPGSPPALPTDNSKLPQWADTYTVWRLESTTHTWSASSDKIVVGKDGTITYNGASISHIVFNGVLISWQAKDNNPNNLSAIFRRVDHITETDPLSGNQLYGRLWTAGEPEPPHGSINMMAIIGAAAGGSDAAGSVGRQALSNAQAAQTHSFFLDLLQMAMGMWVAHYMISLSNKMLGWTGEKIKDKWSESRKKSRALAERKTLEKAQRDGIEGARRAGEAAQKRADKAEQDRIARERPAENELAREQHELEAEANRGLVQNEVAQRDLLQGSQAVRDGIIRGGRDGPGKPGIGEPVGEPIGEPIEKPWFEFKPRGL